LFQTRQKSLGESRRGAPLLPLRQSSYYRRRRLEILSALTLFFLMSEVRAKPLSCALLPHKRDQPVADVFGIGFVAFQLLS
jgi:hypothetical protein